MHGYCVFFQTVLQDSMDKVQLKAYRSRRGLSQKALATELDIHWRSIQEYEAGNLPVPRTVELACIALEGMLDTAQ